MTSACSCMPNPKPTLPGLGGRETGRSCRTHDVDAEAAASAAGKSECAAGKSESIQHTALQQLSLELQRVRAMASSSVPFRVGALAELLVDDYARLGFARGSHVEVLEIVPGGLTDLVPYQSRPRRQRHCRLPGKGRPAGPASTPCCGPGTTGAAGVKTTPDRGAASALPA